MNKKIIVVLVSIMLVISLAGCSNDSEPAVYQDGSYRVEGDAAEHGWTPFIEVEIKDNAITSVTYDYFDESGALKTEDAEYAASMEPTANTTPEKYSKELESQLIDTQNISKVDDVSGATSSSTNFKFLAEAALNEYAAAGETGTHTVTIVK